MKKLKNILVIPTLISVFLGASYLGLSLQYSNIGWVETLKESFFFLMLSEILLLMLSVLIHFGLTDMKSRLRALFAEQNSIDFMCRIEDFNEKSKKSYVFFKNQLNKLIKDFFITTDPLREGRYVCSNLTDIMECTKNLYIITNVKIEAISSVAFLKYWKNSYVGPIALYQNRQALERGVIIERIFIFSDYIEIIESIDILKSYSHKNMSILYVLAGELDSNLIEDFSIYDDDNYVQYFEFNSKYERNKFLTCTITVAEDELKKHRQIYEEIKSLARELDVQDDKILKSVWHSDKIKRFYHDNVDLYMNRIKGTFHNILDIGCGTGRTLEPFVHLKSCEITGIDTDLFAVTECRKRITHANIIHGSFLDYSFSGEKFDLIITYNTIYHSIKSELFDALNKIYDLLIDGGYLLITLKTLKGNEKVILPISIEIEVNTWYNVNYPDFWENHHFSTDEEIEEIISRYRIIEKIEIPLVEENGVIVQGRGYYFILQKK